MKQLSKALRSVDLNLYGDLQPVKDNRKRVKVAIQTKDGYIFKGYGMYEVSKWGAQEIELDSTSLRMHKQGLGKKPDLAALVELGFVTQKGMLYFVPYGV
jgi:hypothetical protein